MVGKDVIEKAFHAAYWLAKQEVPNEKFNSLIAFIEKGGVEDMIFFQQRSRSSVREMFLILGETIRQELLGRLAKVNSYGILTDEVSDIAVMQQLVTFIKYVWVKGGYTAWQGESKNWKENPKSMQVQVALNG